MAESLSQAAALGLDEAVIARVTVSLEAYAYTVKNEVSTTPNHALRSAFADKVVQGPDAYGAQLARIIAAVDTAGSGAAYISTNPPSSANVTDATINADVVVGFNLLAGID